MKSVCTFLRFFLLPSCLILVSQMLLVPSQQSWGQTGETAQHSPGSLKEAVRGRFVTGVGVAQRILADPACANLIRQQFEILTPENCMKPQSIHPQEDRWNFAAPDRFVQFAQENDLAIVGHCLVWAKDDRTDEWMKQGPNETPVTRELLLKRISDHVEAVVKRYQKTATMWDVVNEALSDGDDGYLRDSIYTQTTGIDFIETAFRTAREHDPDALLIYNDYNCHFPGKRKKLVRLLTELKQRGVPVDAYGMQGHFELGDNSLEQLRETFAALRELEIKVVVSELDIDVVTRGKWWADDGIHREELKQFDPYKDSLPAEIADQQAQQYAELFRLFVENRDVIARVSFWNLHDGQSWLNDFPWRRTNHPLLFDRQLQPKSAYHTVLKVLNENGASETKSPGQEDSEGKVAENPLSGHTLSEHRAIQRTDKLSVAAHQQLLLKAKQGTIDVYFQGDSITRRWGATDYPKLLKHWNASFSGWNAANFAWGGDNTHNILWRMRNGELDDVEPKVIVLQTGANNMPWNGPASEQTVVETIEGIQAIVAEFQDRCPDATIILTAMFPRDQNSELRPAILQINQRLQSWASKAKLRFVNINSKLVGEDGRLLPGYSTDGLHLGQPAYEVWAAALRPLLQEILGPAAENDLAPEPTGIPVINN